MSAQRGLPWHMGGGAAFTRVAGECCEGYRRRALRHTLATGCHRQEALVREGDIMQAHANDTLVIKVIVLYGAVAALFSDFLKPLLNFTLFLLIACCVLALVEFLAHATRERFSIAARVDDCFAGIGKHYWFKAVFVTTCLVGATFLLMYTLNVNEPGGFLAQHSEAIRLLQQDLGVANRHLAKIAEHTENIEKHTKQSADNTSELVKQGKKRIELLREFVEPEDARKQLAMIGVPYTVDGYRSKILEGDLASLKLFYEAGWDANVKYEKEGKGAFPLFYAIITSTPNYCDILGLAIDVGNFDPNKTIKKYQVFDSYLNDAINLRSWLCKGSHELQSVFGKVNGAVDCFEGVDANTGWIIAALHPVPEENLLNFIKKYNIDMKSGIDFRKALADGYEQKMKYLKTSMSNLAKIKADIHNYTKKNSGNLYNDPEFARLIGTQSEIEQFKLWYTPEKERYFHEQLERYKAGTRALEQAAAQQKATLQAAQSLPTNALAEKRAAVPEFSFNGFTLSDTPQQMVNKGLADYRLATSFPVQRQEGSNAVIAPVESPRVGNLPYVLPDESIGEALGGQAARRLPVESRYPDVVGESATGYAIGPDEAALGAGVHPDILVFRDKTRSDPASTLMRVGFYTLPGKGPRPLYLHVDGDIVKEALAEFRQRYGEPESVLAGQGGTTQHFWRSAKELAILRLDPADVRRPHHQLYIISLQALADLQKFPQRRGQSADGAQSAGPAAEESARKARF